MPTTTAGTEYAHLERLLLVGRALRTLSERDEERLLEAMDVLWWRMTDDERAEADERPVAAIEGTPVDLGLDRDPEQVRGWPREQVAP